MLLSPCHTELLWLLMSLPLRPATGKRYGVTGRALFSSVQKLLDSPLLAS
jgi:hypothetical protein